MKKEAILGLVALLVLSACDDCASEKESIKAEIGKLNYCTIDSDCVNEYFGCPFDCHSFVNKDADLSVLKQRVEKYRQGCELCEYGCIQAPQLRCDDGKCIAIEEQLPQPESAQAEAEEESEGPACPDCNDNNECTEDSCSADTGYECIHTNLTVCCGDGICMPGESGCDDCPTCKPTKCSTASFDYDKQECVSAKIVPCCGNGICEKGEGCDCNDCSCDEGISLSDYPSFLKNKCLAVVANEGTAQDVMARTNIALQLSSDGISVEPRLANDADDWSSHDMVLVGQPCKDRLMMEILGADDCGFLEPDTALIKLIERGGNQYVILAGYDGDAVTQASKVLIDSEKYDLEGRQLIVDTSGSSPSIRNE